MLLSQSVKDQIASEVGVPFEEIDRDDCYRKVPFLRKLLEKMFPKKTIHKKTIYIESTAKKNFGRGYVRMGEGISAEEMDKRNIEILNRW